MTRQINRRAFLQVLAAATVPAARFTQPERTVIPAGFRGGFLSGFAPRYVGASAKRKPR